VLNELCSGPVGDGQVVGRVVQQADAGDGLTGKRPAFGCIDAGKAGAIEGRQDRPENDGVPVQHLRDAAPERPQFGRGRAAEVLGTNVGNRRCQAAGAPVITRSGRVEMRGFTDQRNQRAARGRLEPLPVQRGPQAVEQLKGAAMQGILEQQIPSRQLVPGLPDVVEAEGGAAAVLQAADDEQSMHLDWRASGPQQRAGQRHPMRVGSQAEGIEPVDGGAVQRVLEHHGFLAMVVVERQVTITGESAALHHRS